MNGGNRLREHKTNWKWWRKETSTSTCRPSEKKKWGFVTSLV